MRPDWMDFSHWLQLCFFRCSFTHQMTFLYASPSSSLNPASSSSSIRRFPVLSSSFLPHPNFLVPSSICQNNIFASQTKSLYQHPPPPPISQDESLLLQLLLRRLLLLLLLHLHRTTQQWPHFILSTVILISYLNQQH